MKAGIIGYAQSGKTTLFNILTGAGASTGFAAKDQVNIGVARVPDPRLLKLSRMFRPVKTTPATVDYMDLPGVAKGEFKTGTQLLTLKNADALVHVIRAFEDPQNPHPEGSVNPARDLTSFELEMILSDLASIETRLERLGKDLKRARSADLEAENRLLDRLKTHLEQEKPLREIHLEPGQSKRVRGFSFLSLKPEIIVLNLSESDVGIVGNAVHHFGLKTWDGRPRLGFSAVCGKIEAEISELSEEDARTFLKELGFSEPEIGRAHV